MISLSKTYAENIVDQDNIAYASIVDYLLNNGKLSDNTSLLMDNNDIINIYYLTILRIKDEKYPDFERNKYLCIADTLLNNFNSDEQFTIIHRLGLPMMVEIWLDDCPNVAAAALARANKIFGPSPNTKARLLTKKEKVKHCK